MLVFTLVFLALLHLTPVTVSFGSGLPFSWPYTLPGYPMLLVLGPTLRHPGLTGCVFAALWFFQVTHSWIWWLVALGVGTLVLVSSRFATQVLLGFCTTIGTLELAWPILLLPWLAGMSRLLLYSDNAT